MAEKDIGEKLLEDYFRCTQQNGRETDSTRFRGHFISQVPRMFIQQCHDRGCTRRSGYSYCESSGMCHTGNQFRKGALQTGTTADKWFRSHGTLFHSLLKHPAYGFPADTARNNRKSHKLQLTAAAPECNSYWAYHPGLFLSKSGLDLP